jgi:hypothetical protein
MRRRAEVTAVDTHGDRLRLITGPTTFQAVASLTVPLASPVVVHLDVLAASHRVRLTATDGSLLATETVACSASVASRPLPGVTRWCHGDRSLVLAARTWRAPLHVVIGCAHRLAARLADRPDSLVVDFPGDGALTALSATELGWRSWHVYPDPIYPHIVATRTIVTSLTEVPPA